MYNRYTPSPDGTFQRTVVPDAPPSKSPASSAASEPPRMEQAVSAPPEPHRTERTVSRPPAQETRCAAPVPQKPPPPAVHSPDRPLRRFLPPWIDPGDLLVLLILLLVLMETDEDDSLTLLLTVAAVILL